MENITKEISVSTGNHYDLDGGLYRVLDERGNVVKVFWKGMVIKEKEKFSQFFGIPIEIVGFKRDREVLLVKTPEMEIAEFYERWLPKDSSHKGKEDVDCFLNLEIISAPSSVQMILGGK